MYNKRRWEKWEIKFLKNNYMRLYTKEIAKKVDDPLNGVRYKAYSYGIKKPRIFYQKKCYANRLSVVEKAYIAGLIDGEGTISIHIRRRNYGNRGYYAEFLLQIANTDINLLRYIRDTIGAGEISNTAWRSCNRMIIADVLNQIESFLLLKRRHADIILAYMKNHGYGETLTKSDVSIIENIYVLNRRGSQKNIFNNKDFNTWRKSR